MNSKAGFTLGDFTFVHPSVNAPLSRFRDPKRRIRGAMPPTYLQPYLRDAVLPGPADALSDAGFCGHREPTFAIFDVVLNGKSEMEFGVQDADGPDRGVCVRPAGGDESDWVLLIRDSLAFTDLAQATARPTKPVTRFSHPEQDVTEVAVALGFEYPPDCGSENEPTWVAVAISRMDRTHATIIYECELQ